MPPPDENTAVDPTGAAWVVWLVIVGPSLLFTTLMCVRRVGPGELAMVVRHGTVIRSRRHGLLLRVPVLQDFETVPVAPRVLPLVVRSTTADGVDVIALAHLELEVCEARPGDPFVPTADVVRLAEETVGAAVQRLEVRSLVDDLESLEAGWPDLVTRRLPAGTRATAVAVTEVEARLTPGGPA
ncbi:hypothetical protein SAMN05192575_103379 [Nocardioides alpinus]|uniref:Band 7 domain-containing protein n=1 Tax=Nocardioides alpinus TaxID=748909 RepID=A0A1I0YAK9_9ACTN|nr:SPFH domain-containing protein [Nocardioides alpinus]SFB10222.1 hypothetical protein SAMN05192575_103379 [Nocardioides alpinus]